MQACWCVHLNMSVLYLRVGVRALMHVDVSMLMCTCLYVCVVACISTCMHIGAC